MNLILISIIASAIITIIVLPYWIKRAREHKLTNLDVHKTTKTKVPELGGLIVSFGAICGILLFIALSLNISIFGLYCW